MVREITKEAIKNRTTYRGVGYGLEIINVKGGILICDVFQRIKVAILPEELDNVIEILKKIKKERG